MKSSIVESLEKYPILYSIVRISAAIKFSIRGFIGKYPLLFYAIYGRKINNPVNKHSLICIEGFPSSANTFTAYAFLKANRANIGHHQHVLAQVVRAKNYGIPILILIRRPLDVVTSLISRCPYHDVNTLLKYYVNFYGSVINYNADCIVVARFETVTENLNVVIDLLNSELGTNFKKIEDFKSVKNEFFQKAPSGTAPSASREEKKSRIKKAASKSKILGKANIVYDKLLSSYPSV